MLVPLYIIVFFVGKGISRFAHICKKVPAIRYVLPVAALCLSQVSLIYRCNRCLYVQQCKEQNPQFRSFLSRHERQPNTKMMR